MVFLKNFKFSHAFFLVKIFQIIIFGAILYREIGFLDHKKHRLKKVAQFAFFQASYSMVFLKNFDFSHFSLFLKKNALNKSV